LQQDIPETHAAARIIGVAAIVAEEVSIFILVFVATITLDKIRCKCCDRGEENKKLWAEFHNWFSLKIAKS
jgi:hypothetical protein